MATNFNTDDEQRHAQDDNTRRLRELALSQRNETDAQQLRRELTKYDEMESELHKLNVTDTQVVNDLELQIRERNRERSMAEKELQLFNEQLENLRVDQETQAKELQQITNERANLTQEITRIQEQLQELRQQQHSFVTDKTNYKRLSFNNNNFSAKDKEVIERAEVEVDRLRSELNQVTEQLQAKQAELFKAEQQKAQLEATLDQEKQVLQHFAEAVQRLEQTVTKAKSELDAAIQSLNQKTERFRQEEQTELEKQKAVEHKKQL
ncbi:unnamed protein product [Sphagnum troendelagicum]|uniref:Uncharacterized protein n=1 Tax=Sphagnum troendelagicum TaxID=128251 RepID=A0ABP0T6M1_9BRYO